MIEDLNGRDLVKIAFSKLKVQQDALTKDERDGKIDRAGSNVVCQRCGLKYVEHPTVEDCPWLIVTCDWRVFHV